MSHYDDVSSRGRSSRSHDYAGDTAAEPPPYPPSSEPAAGAYGGSPRFPSSPGRTPYDAASSQPRLTYDHDDDDAPHETSLSLQVPESTRSRPRSMPPPFDNRDLQSSRHLTRERRRRDRDRHRRRSSHDDGGDYGSDAETPRDRERSRGGFLSEAFTDSKAGLGVGVLGALVGGLAAKEATDATSRHSGHHRRNDPEYKRNQMIGTAVGAVVGALGANAFEKRLEDSREKKERERRRSSPRSSRERDREVARSDHGYYLPGPPVIGPGSGGGGKNTRFLDKTEIIARPRSGSGGRAPDWDPWEDRVRDRSGSRSRRHDSRSRRSLEREVDTDARSWKNVEDWVYDDNRSGGSRRSGSDYHY